MSAVDVIKRKVKDYTLTRASSPTIVDGVSTPGTPVTSVIKAYIQPMTSKDLRNLPQGQNAGEWINIWTENPIQIIDEVPFRGVQFTVQRVSLWDDGPFYIANANHTYDTL